MPTIHPPTEAARKRDLRRRAAWPETSEEIRETFLEAGTRARFPAGHTFFEVGDETYDFIYVLEGEVRIVDRLDDHVVGCIAAGHFAGELGLLTGQRTFLAGVAGTEVEAITIPRERLLTLVREVPEIGDLIIRAYAARRKLLIDEGEGGLTIIGDAGAAPTARLMSFADRNGIPYRFVDRADGPAVAEVAESCAIPDSGLAVVTARGQILTDPEPCDLAERLGLDLSLRAGDVIDVAIVGAGPAGLAAAVYAASEGLSTVIVEDTAIGGQAGTSSRIENYLGFPSGISGGDLAFRAQVQAIKFGAQLVAPRRAIALERDGDHWRLRLEKEESLTARAVVLACGVQWRRLRLPHLEEFEGQGVYYAATELEARHCRGTVAVIVGGGNSAGQAAMYMSRHADCTYVAVRGEGLAETMSSYLADRITSDERIELLTNTEVVALDGDGRLERVTLRDSTTGAERVLPCGALFSMIGAKPNTDWLKGTIELDRHGFVRTGYEVGAHGMATSASGVFAAGDIRAGSVKRVASAVGEGSIVVSALHRFFAEVAAEAPIV